MELRSHSAVGVQEVALVTGAARGIGRSIAEKLAAAGFLVLATDLDAEQLSINQRDWNERGVSINSAPLDCRNRAGIRVFMNEATRIDVIVNNAGLGSPLVAFADLTWTVIREIFEVNFIGTYIVAQEGARRMTAGGRIINIASRGYLGGAGAAHYVASKAAVVGLTRSMAAELRWMGITVNAVAPGMIDTRALQLFEAPMRAKLAALEPSGAAADPTVVADVVVFLSSPAARFITGQILHVDGGKCIGLPPL